MTVSELLDQVRALITAGVIDASTPVLADGCDCTGEALAVVAVQDRQWGAQRMGDPVTKLLISREGSHGEGGAEGIRVTDLRTPSPKSDPPTRTFPVTQGKTCTAPPVDTSSPDDDKPR